MFFSSFTYGYPSDFLGYLFYINEWLIKTLPLTGYLKGIFSPSTPQQTLLSVILYTPAVFIGPINAYNLVLISTLILNFLSAYFVVKRLSGLRTVAVVTALIFSSSVFVQWHAMQNIELAMVFWLPIFLFFLMKFLFENSFKDKLILSLFTALMFMTSFYFGFFSLILVFSVWLLSFLYKCFVTKRLYLAGILNMIVFVAFFVVFTLPSTYIFLDYLGKPSVWSEYSKENIFRSSLNDIVSYGARPWDYLMPSVNHPIFGPLVQNFYQYIKENYSYQFWSTFLPERANYLTFTGTGLALYAVWTAFRSWQRKQNIVSQGDLRNISFLILISIIMFLVSMPAVINLKGLPVYFPSFFLFKLFPMFRVYARSGVLVLLGVSLLAGYGFKFLLANINNDWFFIKLGRISFPGRKSVILTTVLFGLILFENLNFPPFPLMDVGRVPQVYAWLKNQPGDQIIAEYPRDNSVIDIGGGCPGWLDPKITRDYNGAYTAFYQTAHGKKTFVGEKLSKDDRVSLGDLSVVNSYKVLKKYGVNYVLVHTKDPMIGTHSWPYPQENPLDECWQRRIMRKPERVYEGFRKVAEFDDGIVYEIN